MTPLEIGLAIVLPLSYVIGNGLGWVSGHGEYTPFNWRILVWVGWYFRWLDKQPIL